MEEGDSIGEQAIIDENVSENYSIYSTLIQTARDISKCIIFLEWLTDEQTEVSEDIKLKAEEILENFA